MIRDDLVVMDGVLTKYRGPGGAVTLPEGVTRIGDRAFYGNCGLTAIRLPEGLVSIGEKAFSGCLLLEEVRLPESLREIGKEAFLGCFSLREVRFPARLARIGASAFYACKSLRQALLPEALTELGFWAFANCGSLRLAALPRGMESIPPGAFSECTGLEEVLLPEGLRGIDPLAFRGCRALADRGGFLILRGVLFGYFGPRRGTVTLPAEVTEIAEGAFEYGEGLLDLRLRSEVRADRYAFFEEDLILRIPRWDPGLKDSLEECASLILAAEDASAVPARFRRAARLGAALGGAASPKDLAWLRAHASALIPEAFRVPELLRFLCERKLIRPVDTDAYLEEAQRREDPALIALLLDYVNLLGADTVARARARRQAREGAAP